MAIDYQVVQQDCPCCQARFDVSRGSVYRDGQPIGIYLAGMHGCVARQALLAVALRPGMGATAGAFCVCLRAWAAEAEYRISVTEPDESPWRGEGYLGRLLSRADALAAPALGLIFGAADQIVARPPVSTYLEGCLSDPP